MPVQFDVGLGKTGIGENFAKSRLLLAKRAGYIPADMQFSQNAGASSAMWRSVSKNLARDARSSGFQNPMMFLRAGAQAGGQLPGRKARMPVMPSLPYSNSAQALIRSVNPMMDVNPMLQLIMRNRMLGGRGGGF